MATSGIDVAILSSIWTKAEKYLGLPNAIIEEPTDDLTKKFKVFSKSHADQPNVVIVHQDGMIHCPCLMFTTSPNLCSHAVPVAHKQGILEGFLDKVREKATSEPNLYAVSTVNVNTRSACQKGGIERRKRFNTPRSRATVTLAGNFCSTDRLRASINTSQAITHPTNPQMVTHSTTPQVVTHPTMPQMVTHSSIPQVVTHPNFSLPQVVTYSGVKQPWHNSNLFVVMAITNRVKRCAGCPFEYSNPHGPVFTGLVIQHKERDVYHTEGNARISNETNRYYHCEPTCIVSRHPYFTQIYLLYVKTLS
jgi:hypothetical protein